MKSEKTTRVRACGRSVRAYYEGGQAWIWDSVAGHYTSCHSLTDNQIMRIKRLANRDA